MKLLKKIVLIVFGVVVAVLVGYGVHYAWQNGPVGAGYKAKIFCSCVFVSNRKPDTILSEDLTIPGLSFINAEVNYKEKSVTASLPGLIKVKRRAVYREGLGCTLLIDTTEEELRKQAAANPAPLPPDKKDLLWPVGDRLPDADFAPGVDVQKLNDALDDAFSEPDPDRPRRTRAVVVIYDSRIIAERYAPGFSKDTRLLGWSMTKSVNSALIGILVGQGKLSVHDPAPVPEWREPGDPRGTITLDQLLRMSSGLEFMEEYESNPTSDAGIMFFSTRDMAAFAAAKPLETEPGGKWSYSSGTSNILARIIRDSVGGPYTDYISFPRRELFNRIDMRSAIIEPDASGTFVGAGYMYATARDWARFGLLYLNDGYWEGDRILPEGWVEYTRKPTPNTPPADQYGAQFWLNAGGEGRWLPGLPTDLYSARGHEGQYVTIIPSRDLVVVRMGLTRDEDAWDHESFVAAILEAVPK